MTAKTNNLTCDCGKTCKTLAGLRAHQRHCNGTKIVTKAPVAEKKLTPKEHAIIRTKHANHNLTSREIGKLVGCDQSHVSKVLKKYGIKHGDVTEFKKHRADVFAGLQNRILQTITLADIKKAPMASRVTAMAILNDKERLERGQSTSNIINIHSDIKAMKEAHNRNKSNDTNAVP